MNNSEMNKIVGWSLRDCSLNPTMQLTLGFINFRHTPGMSSPSRQAKLIFAAPQNVQLRAIERTIGQEIDVKDTSITQLVDGLVTYEIHFSTGSKVVVTSKEATVLFLKS